MESFTSTDIKSLKISHKWIISNISLVHEIGDFELCSSNFPKNCKKSFVLNITESNSENLIIKLKSETVKNRNFKATILVADESHLCTNVIHCFNNEFTFPPKKWTKLFENKNTLLKNDILILSCKILMLKCHNTDSASYTILQLPQSNLTENFATLLTQKDFNDVQIETSSGHKIPANKFILSARSKVFAAMFEHPTEENQENYIKISDFSREVIAEMLHFIYTDEAPNLGEVAEDLIAAADKYGLERLKAMCARCLSKNLSAKNAALTLKLADLHNEKELKTKATEYMKKSLMEVVLKEGYTGLITTDEDLILKTLESQIDFLVLEN